MSRILVVDDEHNVLTSFQKLLGREGHEVLTASSGEQALQLLAADQPDLMLLDVRMAGLTGLETLKRVREFAPRLPVIIMTAFGTTDTAMDAVKLGAFEYLLKPFEVSTLRVLVQMALTSRQSQ
jgi:DNA-binding NtrC family response regulator